MLNNRKSLKNPRNHAFNRQNGRCCYCHQPIWVNNPEQYAKQYGLTLSLARLMKCTGEHLVAHKDGGSSNKVNIAAACLFCNLGRHRCKKDMTPVEYEQYVLRRLKKGRWHGLRLVN